MLKKLHISNFALIEELKFEPGQKFIAITGETGAGKSILLGALGLILGKRSQGTDLFDKTKKCIIEGSFSSNSNAVAEFLKVEDFDCFEDVIIRREITLGGKSRSFINDTPASLTQLKTLGEKLIDIHSQHGHLALKSPDFVLYFLDSFIGIKKEVEAFTKLYNEVILINKKLKELEEKQVKSLLDKDYFEFLSNEIEELKPVEGELAELENNLGQFQHAEEIQSNISNALSALDEDGGQVISNILKAENLISQLKGYSPNLDTLLERLTASRIEMEDLRSEMDIMQGNVEYNPEKLEQFTERVNEINTLLHKHHLSSEKDLLSKLSELQQNLVAVNDLGIEIENLKKEIDILSEKLKEIGGKISKKRRTAAKKVSPELLTLLNGLGIKNGQIEFEIQELKIPMAMGFNKVSLMFSANAGKEVREVSKVASGGELSRIILSIKSILAQKIELPSIVFDEIDSGVSGEVANQMGSIMKNMSEKMQVISITHLPQIASKGTEHYSVKKQNEKGKAKTSISKVIGEGRILELAKMLSGEQVSAAAKENAKMMLNN